MDWEYVSPTPIHVCDTAVGITVNLTLDLIVGQRLLLSFLMLPEHSLYVERCVLQGMQATAAADPRQASETFLQPVSQASVLPGTGTRTL